MNKICISFAMLAALLLAESTAAQVIRVPGQISTIQKALDTASAGTTILVDQGIYKENLVWPSINGIRLIAVDGPLGTIIDGDGKGRVVTFPAGLTRVTLLQGFLLRNGADVNGAGVSITHSSPTLRFNHIVGNNALGAKTTHGAGVYIDGRSSPLLERNLILQNVLQGAYARGGGICVAGGADPVIRANRIFENTCHFVQETTGCGVCILGNAASTICLGGNEIARNKCGPGGLGNGGGVAVLGGPVDILNNTIVGNDLQSSTQRKGGGIYIAKGARPGSRMINNIVSGNHGGGIHVDGGNPILNYNDVWQNAGGNYSGTPPGPSDISVDPGFVGPADLHLYPGSPLIDQGINIPAVDSIGLDVDGDPRFVDGDLDGLQGDGCRADMGADEFARAKLALLGVPWIGTGLGFEVVGPDKGYDFVVFWSPHPSQVLIRPYGHLLINGFSFIGGGKTPGRVMINVPAVSSMVGVPVHVQGLAVRSASSLVGSFTNRLDLTLLPAIQAVRETFTSTGNMDPVNTTARWTRGPGNAGLFSTFGYGGDGSDGDLMVTGKVTLDSDTRQPGSDGIVAWNFRSVVVAPGGTLTLKGTYPIRLNVQRNCTIHGKVLLHGKNGLNAPAGPASQVGILPGGGGGPGGGAGGSSNVNPSHPIGALPMELRGGPGYPKAQVCGEPNRSSNRLITVIEPNCGGGTGGNRGTPSGTILRSGCSGNGGGHMMNGIQTDYLCSNIGAFGREFGVAWILPTGGQGVMAPTGGTGGGAGGNAAITTGLPKPADDIVAGSGGGAGGGLEVVAFETLHVASAILAHGGNGGMGWSTVVGSSTVSGGWGAGGAGGSIWLSGTSVVVDSGAQVNAQGGLGNPIIANPSRTGNGGDGYIIIRDRGGNPVLNSTSIKPAPVAGRNLFTPQSNGKSAAFSLFYDSGRSNPNWSFDANNPQTGEVKPGKDLLFLSPPALNQKVFIAFQGAPDLNGKPDPNPSSWFPQGAGNYEADIQKLALKKLRHIRFRILIDLGVRIKGQPAQHEIALDSVTMRF